MKKKLIFLEILIILIFIIILLSSILFLNIIAYRYFLAKKDAFLNEITEITGFKIEFKKISPYIIGKIKIYEVILYNPNGTILKLGNIEISYSLLSIFSKNKNPIKFIKKIKLKKVDIELNKQNDFDEIISLIKRIKSKMKFKSFNVNNLTIEIPYGKINIIDNNKNYIIESNKLKILFKNNIKINTYLNIYVKKNNFNKFKSNIKLDGFIEKRNQQFNTIFSLDLIKTYFGESQLKTQRFVFKSNGPNFKFNRIPDSSPIIFNISKNNEKISSIIDINSLNMKELFTANIENKIIPDKATIKSDFNYNLKTKDKTGSIIFNIYYNKLFLLENFGTDIDLLFNKDEIKINKFIIFNHNNKNNISIDGAYPLNNKDYKITVNFNNFKLPKTIINTKLFITKKNNYINFFSNNIFINNQNFDNFNIQIFKNKKNKNEYNINTIKKINGYEINGSIKKEKNDYLISLNHDFNYFSIGKIINAYNSKKRVLFLNGTLNTSFSKNNFEIKESVFNLINNFETISTFKIKLINKLFVLSNLKIKLQNNDFDINGWFNFKKSPLFSYMNIKNDKLDLNFYTKISNKTIDFNFNNDLNINYNKNDNKITFVANDFKIPIKNNNTKINFNFAYNLKTKRIDDNKITIKNCEFFKNQTGVITTKLSLKNNQLSLKNFKYEDNLNLITGQTINFIDIKNKIIEGKGFFKDDKKDESYSFDYNIGKDIEAKIFITHFNLNKIIKNNKINGFLNVRANITGKITNPKIDLEFDISKANFGRNKFNLFCYLNKRDNKINLKSINISLGKNRISVNDAQISLQDFGKKDVYINGSIYLEGLQKKLKANFLLIGNYVSLKNPELPFDFNFELYNTTIAYLQGYEYINVEKFDPIQFNINRNDEIITINNYGDKFVFIKKEDKSLQINLFKDKNLFFDSVFQIKNKKIDGNLKFYKFPVNIIQKLLIPFISIDNGLLDGNINITGNITDPKLNGKLNLYYGAVTLPDYLKGPIENISGIIIADNDKILVRNVNGESKKGLAHGYGEILLNGWKLDRYYFQVNSDSVPAKIEKGPIIGTGVGYVDKFIFEGKPRSFNFIGDIVLETADIDLSSRLGMNQKIRLRKMPINVYVKFTAGNKVKVNYPIINGIVTPGDIFILKFIGDEPNIYFGGNISLKKGEVNYLNKKFKIEHANFKFNEDEIKINPIVDLKAFIRTKDSRKEPVVIYLNMRNRLIPFDTVFSSFPYKTQEEISGILGLSYSPEENEFAYYDNSYSEYTYSPNYANIETIKNTFNYFGTFLVSPIESKIRQITQLDTFVFETDFFGNILKADAGYNTLDLLDNSSLTIGKYIFDELYFESMMSFHKKENYSDKIFLPLRDQNYGFNLQFMLQLELPYVYIGYSFIPNDYSNLLNADHEISIEFNYKF